MGFLTRLFRHSLDQVRNGERSSMNCDICGTTYNGNFTREFPYAICGSCLERAARNAERHQDYSLLAKIRAERQRRSDTFFY